MPLPNLMSQYSFCFSIASESEYFGPARLHITPSGYEKDTNGQFSRAHRNRVYGLYVTARFEDDGRKLNYEITDFVPPCFFRDLERLITASSHEASSAALDGDDGYLEINFRRDADEHLRITCTSPSHRWSVDCLRLTFECTVNPESLADVRKQLKALLELVDKIDSGSVDD